MRNLALLLQFALVTGCVSAAAGAVVFEDGFEALHERWRKDIRGEGTIDLVDGGYRGRCLRIATEGGYAYLTTTLDAEALRGRTVVFTGMVKLENVRQGAQSYSTPKFHVGQRVAGATEVQNFAERWTGTFDWQPKSLRVDVAENATGLVLDIGNQNGHGVFLVDEVKLEVVGGTGRPLPLLPVCNTGRSDGVAGDGRGSFLDLGPLDLYALPEGALETPEATFVVPAPGANAGKVALTLAGRERAALPPATDPLPVGRTFGRLALLHAAAWADAKAGEPCYAVEVAYDDGQAATWTLTAGTDLGNFDDPGSCRRAPAWSAPSAAGRTVAVWAAVWNNPRPEATVASLRFVSAGAGVPIVLAATLLPKEAPAP